MRHDEAMTRQERQRVRMPEVSPYDGMVANRLHHNGSQKTVSIFPLTVIRRFVDERRAPTPPRQTRLQMWSGRRRARFPWISERER